MWVIKFLRANFSRISPPNWYIHALQVSGEKHLTLFDPHHNENLYEAHIPEALLTYSEETGQFLRHRLLESTSMVMSPVDITSAPDDLARFPRFSEARRLECSLEPGDALFMPAFWWHEVRSSPDQQERRNLAVNFWYVVVYSIWVSNILCGPVELCDSLYK